MPMRISTQLEDAVAVLHTGGILAYPTESVFGLGCDPRNEAALERLLQIKQRPAHKGLILIAAQLEQLVDYIEPLNTDVLARILPTWPGPYTWILPTLPKVSSRLRGEHAGLAVRISAHPTCQALCQQFGHPLVSTSANPATQAPARHLSTLSRYFSDQIDLALNLPLGEHANPSEIRDALTGQLIRSS